MQFGSPRPLFSPAGVRASRGTAPHPDARRGPSSVESSDSGPGRRERSSGRLGHGWGQTSSNGPISSSEGGAGDGLRTRYLDLGKVALYQVSYSRSARGTILPG